MTEQQKIHQNLPNGLLSSNFVGSGAILTNVPLNGVDSSASSSKTSSPAHRIQNIPVSQLPPSRIPPPMTTDPVKQLSHNYANLNLTTKSTSTPYASPKAQQNFSTSTPNKIPLSAETSGSGETPSVSNISPLNRTAATTNVFARQPNSNSPANLFETASNNLNHNEQTSSSSNLVQENEPSFKEVPLVTPSTSQNNNLPRDDAEQTAVRLPKASPFRPTPVFPPTAKTNFQQTSHQQAAFFSSNIPTSSQQQSSLGPNRSLNRQQDQNVLSTQTVSSQMARMPPQSSPLSRPSQPLNDQTTQFLPTQRDILQPSLQKNYAAGSISNTSLQNQQQQNFPINYQVGATPTPPVTSGTLPNQFQQALSSKSYNAESDVPSIFTPKSQYLQDSTNIFQGGSTIAVSTALQNQQGPKSSSFVSPTPLQNRQQDPSLKTYQGVATIPFSAAPTQSQQDSSKNYFTAGPRPNMKSYQTYPPTSLSTNQQQTNVAQPPPPSQGSYMGGSNVPLATQQYPAAPLPTQQYNPILPGNQQQQPPPLLSAQNWNQPSSMDKNQPPPPLNQNLKTNLHTHRYPTMNNQNNPPVGQPQMITNTNQRLLTKQNDSYQFNDKSNVVQGGFSRLWGHENVDLLQTPNILPPQTIEPPRIILGQEHLEAANCSPSIMRCTVTKIPSTNVIMQKSRLPLGLLVHPFKDLDHLAVVQCAQIVRCRTCRTYINPFVFFIDMKRWKCNLCYRPNELPDEFQFDPVTKSFGDPSRRPEIKSSTIEFIAPPEYMLRPPQPAVYLFLLDVSRLAIETGYLEVFCKSLSEDLPNLPGDARTQIGFIAFNSAIHFYSLAEGLSQPHELSVLDIEDPFLPCPDNLLVNLNERKELIQELLQQLPYRFKDTYDVSSALGSALQIGHKLIASTGGRITVFQTCLPNCGPGKLTSREDPNKRSGNDVPHLNPATDFYKKLALDCSGLQIAVDLFVLNSQYVDLATISCVSRFSGGCIYQYPLFKASNVLQAESLERCLKRYLTRKVGFEAVLRVRCTRGLEIHAFHGNGFIRSMDLLSLPNINPDDGYGIQLSYTESLADLHTVCFQAALLYTSSKGERRIRVHTMCLPVTSTLPEVLASADQQAIIAFLAKMGVDRSMQSSLVDAREAFINVAIDILSTYKVTLNLGSGQSGLLLPQSLKFIPLYISALLKHIAFRTGVSTRLDDRIKAMLDMKSLPVSYLIRYVYPDLYPIHNLEEQVTALSVDGEAIPQPPHLQLSARSLDSKGAFLLDTGNQMIVLVGPNVSPTFLNEALGVPDYNSIHDTMYDLPILNNHHNIRLNSFINFLNDDKPFAASLHIIRENSPHRGAFLERLIEDRFESALSYHEFLQHLKSQVK